MPTWNITQGIEQRLRTMLGLTSTPDIFDIEKDVKVTLDYSKVMEIVETLVIPATAGNVSTLISPGKGKMFEIEYGRLNFTNDATVATRTPRLRIVDKNSTIINTFYQGSIAASLSTAPAFAISANINDPASTSADNTYDPRSIKTYETDSLEIILGSGVAGDSYEGIFKIITKNIPRET